MFNDNVPQLQTLFDRQHGGVFRRLWWFQDAALAHRLITVQDRLRELFGNRVVLGHAVEWPPRSPDSRHVIFFFGVT